MTRRHTRSSGGLKISGDVPTLAKPEEDRAVLSALQDVYGYLWFLVADPYARRGDPEVAWGYDDMSLCGELRSLGAKKFMQKYVVDSAQRYLPWYWRHTIDAPILARLMRLPVTTVAVELASAAQRINSGVNTPEGRRVFGNAQMCVGFSVPAYSGKDGLADDDLREDVQMFWHDAMTLLGPRNGPALLAHQISKCMENSWSQDTLATEQLAELLSQGAFDAWLSDPADSQPSPIDVTRYGGSASLMSGIDAIVTPLHRLMRSIRIEDPPWMMYRSVIAYVRTIADLLVERDEYPEYVARGVARSCRGRRVYDLRMLQERRFRNG